jgi:hypothetical protein
MNNNSSPGLDGFGPAFSKRHSDLVKDNLLASLDDFHSVNSDLWPINKSYIVLLPKRLITFAPSLFKTAASRFTQNVWPCVFGGLFPALFTRIKLASSRGDLSLKWQLTTTNQFTVKSVYINILMVTLVSFPNIFGRSKYLSKTECSCGFLDQEFILTKYNLATKQIWQGFMKCLFCD